jgi:succinate dehydrogenase / fumarate reductase flavoprotein subunit
LEQLSYDAIVIGGGLAGLMAAHEIAKRKHSVAVISKVFPTRSHSACAEGGIAAYVKGNSDPNDSPEYLAYDTIKGGDYLVDQDAAEVLANMSGDMIILMERWGALFNRQPDGRIALRYFGGQTYPRTRFVADKTGMALLHTVYERVSGLENITFYSEWFAVELLRDEERVRGVIAINMRDERPAIFLGKAVIMATGGMGMLYRHTTNSYINTGDGYSMALRAGVALKDPEFVQFHPTALYPSDILISEAARGEGGILVNNRGERFMLRYAPQKKELAPRDIVSKSITIEIREGRGFPGGYVHLDLRHLGEQYIKERLALAREAGINFAGVDPVSEPLPVRPAQHYYMGGIDVDVNGYNYDLRGLFAAGEVACVSVHGANRLGSNSLLETLVFGYLTGKAASEYIEKVEMPSSSVQEQAEKLYSYVIPKSESGIHFGDIQERLRDLMWEKVGIFRDEQNLKSALIEIAKLREEFKKVYVEDKSRYYNTEFFNYLELRNMLDLAVVVTATALNRTETRGAQIREDYPERDDKNWLKHTIAYFKGGEVQITYKPVTITKWKPEVRTY